MNGFHQTLLFLISVVSSCSGQGLLNLSPGSFVQIQRMKQAVPKGRVDQISDIWLRFYKNSSAVSSFRLRDSDLLIKEPGFDSSRRTLVYVHGYIELVGDESVQRLVAAYSTRGDHNVLVVDWSNMAFGFYVGAALDTKPAGKAVGRALTQLVRSGVPSTRLRLVGHSLGAHLLAYAARILAEEEITVPSLVGLDPAFPGFYPNILGTPMSTDDAEFVLALHTDGGQFGAPISLRDLAHAHFLANGGRSTQPGCPARAIPFTAEDFCNHWRSWKIWAEAVESTSAMDDADNSISADIGAGGVDVIGGIPARRCGSYDAFVRAQCKQKPIVNMGPDIDPGIRGYYYFRTAASEPFSLGLNGA